MLTFQDKQGDTFPLRFDAELHNCGKEATWATTGNNVVTTGMITAVPRANNATGDFAYSCSFPDGRYLSSYLNLNNDVLSQLVNGILKLKIITVSETTVAGAKGAKEVVKVDEVLAEVLVPLSRLLSCHVSCSLSSSMGSADNTDETLAGKEDAPTVLINSGCKATVNRPSLIASKCSLCWSAAADDALAEYVVGSSVISFNSPSLSRVPTIGWTIPSPDPVDPKAKVQPTAEDLRKKYIDNVVKLCQAQHETFTITSRFGGASDATSNLPKDTMCASGSGRPELLDACACRAWL